MIKARDGIQLACHQYSPNTATPLARIIFFHGSSFNSRRYANLAKACVQQGYEAVLCDWRGHGSSQGTPGTCTYVGQLEDDVADIINYFEHHQPLTLVLGGHSSGSMICLRYIKKYGQDKIDGCYFIAPAVSNTMEPMRYESQSFKNNFLFKYFRKKQYFTPAPQSALKHMPKVKHKLFLLAAMFPFLRQRTVVRFPGTEKMAALEGRVLSYSYNLSSSLSVGSYAKSFAQIKVPVIFICGEVDEILHVDFLPMLCQWHLSPFLDKQVHMLPKLNHMSVINGASRIFPNWLNERWGQKDEKKQPLPSHNKVTEQVA
jgi:alpha-beta hydrolase superfamily lysophospholipase